MSEYFDVDVPIEGGTFTARVLDPGARPSASVVAQLDEPGVVWEDPQWWGFVERTDLHEARYLEVREGDELVAVAPLLVTEASGGLLFYDPPRLIGTAGSMARPELLDPQDQARWEELTAELPSRRDAQYPSLTCGTFGSHHGILHGVKRGPDRRAAFAEALPQVVRVAARQLGCRSSALLYVGEPQARSVDAGADAANYDSVLLGADGILHLGETSYDSYLESLSSRRRTRLRKELRQFERDGFRAVMRSGPGAIDDEVVALQVAHRAKYGLPGGEERVKRDFLAIDEEMGDRCVLFGAERDGRLWGFVLFLRTADALFARTAGFAPEARGCYFALTYHEAARWATENGIGRIHYGLAAYEAKFARGCTLEPRWGWFDFDGSDGSTRGDGPYSDLAHLQSLSIERCLEQVGADIDLLPSRERRHGSPVSARAERGQR